nr:MAG TPA: Single strand binding protein [Caudoviricetes sp.]
MSINRVVLLGNMTRDPELRRTGTGKAVTNFTLALNRYNNDEADFVDCVCWERIAENTAQYCSKGSKVAVEGSIQTGSYVDKDGHNRKTVNVLCNRVEFINTNNSSNNLQPQINNNYNNLNDPINSYELQEDDIAF